MDYRVKYVLIFAWIVLSVYWSIGFDFLVVVLGALLLISITLILKK